MAEDKSEQILEELSSKIQDIAKSDPSDRLSAIQTLIQNLQRELAQSQQQPQNADTSSVQIMQEVAQLANQVDAMAANIQTILGLVSAPQSGGLA